MKIFDRRSVWIIGFFVGGTIGVAGAPAWEMAGLFVEFFGAVTGAVSAQWAVWYPKGLISSILATIVGSGSMFLLSRQNQASVATTSTLLVAMGGVIGCGFGFIAGRIFRAAGDRAP